MSKKIADAVQARVEKEAAILAKKKAEKLASDIRKSSDIEIRKLAISDEDLLGYLNENIAGAAKLYCRLHRGSVVFVKYWERFLIWNKHHWEEDDYDVAYQLTEDICELYMRLADKYQVLADEAGNKNESAAYQRITDTAMRKVSSFRDPTGQEKIIKMIRRIRNPLIALPKHFDIRHYEKAAPNGVIDLRTGSLREGRPEDYMLKHIVTEYDTALFTDVVEHGTDPCPVSNAYLLSSMDGNAEVVDFIWRLLGWGLITERLDHKFIIFWGEHGRNGKDTLIKLVTETLGLELSGDANVEMLLQQQQSKNSSAPSPDIMALRGMSLAWFNEAEENQSFAMAKLKKLTGGGYGTRWVMQCRSNETGYPIVPQDAVFVVIAGGTISNGSVLKDHKLMRSVKFQAGAKYGAYNMDYAGIYGCDALASIDGLDFGAASSIMNALSAKALTKIKNLKNLNNSFKIIAPYIDAAGINDIINDLKNCTGATQCTITLPTEIKNRLTTE